MPALHALLMMAAAVGMGVIIGDKNMYELRAHHGMCLYYFNGKGYSEQFTSHMVSMKILLNNENPLICVVSHTDCICSQCPHNGSGHCTSFDKTERYDKAVLACCELSENNQLPFRDFQLLVLNKIILPGKRSEICGDCQWNELCR